MALILPSTPRAGPWPGEIFLRVEHNTARLPDTAILVSTFLSRADEDCINSHVVLALSLYPSNKQPLS